MKYSISYYTMANGKVPFEEWLFNLRDRIAYGKILIRLESIEEGRLGQIRGLKNGLLEFKINLRPGYRIYFTFESSEKILILCAGTKHTQKRDILKAKQYLRATSS